MSEPVLGVAPVPGVDITGVIYRYTAVKDRPDDFTVTVRNQNAIDSGYIFSETDDWSGRSGQTINKLTPVGHSPIKYWGDGEITTTGVGSVIDPDVVYTYRVDTCYDPQSNPDCPGYIAPPAPAVAVVEEPEPVEVETPTYDPYAAYREELVQQAMTPTDREKFLNDDEEVSKDDEEVEKEDMEKALATSDAAMELAEGQTGMIAAMNPVTMHNYYAMNLPGGVYKETVILQGGEIKDNRRAFRSMANDRLHTEMVGSQWK
jgi:hypothetical protein